AHIRILFDIVLRIIANRRQQHGQI
ncbi:unnamed protein product, partial [Rotaria sp. Silwood1]